MKVQLPFLGIISVLFSAALVGVTALRSGGPTLGGSSSSSLSPNCRVYGAPNHWTCPTPELCCGSQGHEPFCFDYDKTICCSYGLTAKGCSRAKNESCCGTTNPGGGVAHCCTQDQDCCLGGEGDSSYAGCCPRGGCCPNYYGISCCAENTQCCPGAAGGKYDGCCPKDFECCSDSCCPPEPKTGASTCCGSHCCTNSSLPKCCQFGTVHWCAESNSSCSYDDSVAALIHHQTSPSEKKRRPFGRRMKP